MGHNASRIGKCFHYCASIVAYDENTKLVIVVLKFHLLLIIFFVLGLGIFLAWNEYAALTHSGSCLSNVANGKPCE